MRRPRSSRMPLGTAGVWHVLSRCVRKEMLLAPEGRREWFCARLASWCNVLAIDLLGYAIMGNHFHLIVRTRPDRATQWSDEEVCCRIARVRQVTDGAPAEADASPPALLSRSGLVEARAQLSHPGAMLRAVKEGCARRINKEDQTAGHVWESRYQDVAILDGGGALACMVYVDLNPFRAKLVEIPEDSSFCSARHRRGVKQRAPDAVLAHHLVAVNEYPILDHNGQPLAGWPFPKDATYRLTLATAKCLTQRSQDLPSWAVELLPRLGLSAPHWVTGMGQGGTLSGNVVGSWEARRRHAGSGRMGSDKTKLFMGMDAD